MARVYSSLEQMARGAQSVINQIDQFTDPYQQFRVVCWSASHLRLVSYYRSPLFCS
jgi:hypothetical protein